MRANIFKIKKAVTKICLTAALLLSAVTISNLVSPSITAYAAEDGEVTISDTITGVVSDGGTVITIRGTGKIPQLSSYVTGYTTINTVIIEEGITGLDNNAFKGWKGLTNIVLPQGLTTMGYYVFDGCTSLTELTIPKTFTTASTTLNSSLGNANITTITFEDGMTKIPDSMCFECTKLTTVNIPESVTTIGKEAFRKCTSLTNINLPSNLVTIGNNAFYKTAIAEITIPKTVTTATDIFTMSYEKNTYLKKITFENGMTAIPANICNYCNVLTEVNIPNSVKTINNNAFNYCPALIEITIPGSVTYIGNSAFSVTAQTPITVTTPSTYVSGLNWSSKFKRTATFIDPSAFQEGLTMTGTVSPITTIDITIPLDAFQFRIDEERNLEVQTTEIVNNSQYPLEMYILNIEATNDEPNIVAKDTFTEKEWNNLSAAQTLSNIAISLNEHELYTIFNNTELDNSKAIKIGDIKSGFVEAQILEVTPDVQYGKAFYNTDEVTLTYKIVFEVVIP